MVATIDATILEDMGLATKVQRLPQQDNPELAQRIMTLVTRYGRKTAMHIAAAMQLCTANDYVDAPSLKVPHPRSMDPVYVSIKDREAEGDYWRAHELAVAFGYPELAQSYHIIARALQGPRRNL